MQVDIENKWHWYNLRATEIYEGGPIVSWTCVEKNITQKLKWVNEYVN